MSTIKIDRNENVLIRSAAMSYLSQAIAQVLEEEGMNQTELSKLSGVDGAKISRIIHGQPKIRPDDLAKITSAISKDPHRRARIIAARLRDMCKGPGSELVEINVLGDISPLHESPRPKPLPAPVQKAWNVIQDHITDPDLQSIIISLGRLFEEGKP